MTAALSLVSWNVTRRCNLRCPHCYLDAGARSSDDDELTTLEGRDFIDQLAALCFAAAAARGRKPSAEI
ncbi:MAG: hypothetical protein ACE5FI_17705 [Anaerolineales bacterium]